MVEAVLLHKNALTTAATDSKLILPLTMFYSY